MQKSICFLVVICLYSSVLVVVVVVVMVVMVVMVVARFERRPVEI